MGITPRHFYCILLTRPDPNGRGLRDTWEGRDDQEARLTGEAVLNLAATEDRVSIFKMRGETSPWQKGPREQGTGMCGEESDFSFDHFISKVKIRPER